MARFYREFVNQIQHWLIRIPVSITIATSVFLFEYYVVPDSEQVEVSASSPEVMMMLVACAGAFMLFGLTERTGIAKVYNLSWSYVHRIAEYGRKRMPRVVSLAMLKLLRDVGDNAHLALVFLLASPLLLPSIVAWKLIFPWVNKRVWEPLFKQMVPVFWLTLNSSVYSSLQQTEPTIRLLQLHPGRYDDPLECHLVVADVYDAEFEAVSYAWGGHLVLRRTIFVNGSPFHVTENIIKALRHLRRTDATRVLWIDQMCINQLDNAEKTDQVTHKMHLVYSNATQVIAWLGIGSPDISWAFQRAKKYPGRQFNNMVDAYYPPAETPAREGLAESLFFKLIGYPLSWAMPRSSSQNEEEPELKKENPGLRRYQDVWLNIFGRRWFRRIWVIQETALARHLTIKCGDAEISWDMLKRTAKDLQKIHDLNPSNHAQALINFTGRIDHEGKADLLDLAIRFRKHESSDPRDKLVGLLALASDGRRFPEVGYRFHDMAVFANFTVACIQRSQSLAILGLAETRGDNDVLLEASMCTWALNWASHDSNIYRTAVIWGTRLEKSLIAEQANYSACGHRPAVCRREEGPPIPPLVRGIFLRGWHEDSIKAISAMGTEWGMLTILPIWTEFITQQLPNDFDLHDNFEALITAELLGYADHPWNKWYVPQKGSETKKNQDVPGDIREASLILEKLCHGRRLFVTDKGRLGIGPSGMSIGDEVCILEGSAVPIILRRWRDFKRLLPGGFFSRKPFDYDRPYCYVGQAVVSGLMYASSEEVNKRVETGDIVLSDIWLR